jgi:hypothetical protein
MRSFIFLGLFCFISIGAFSQVDVTFNGEKLFQDVHFLSQDSLEGRETGTHGELIAATYISKRFEEIGLIKKGSSDTSYLQVFKKKTRLHPHDNLFAGKEIVGRNVLGFIDNNAKHTVIVGAHYDHLGWGKEGSLYTGEPMIHNGADDNASGVAALLMLANELVDRKMKSNFLFIAFSGEEKGLLGSNYFVKNSTLSLNDVSFMVNMDMIGRLDTNRRLALYGVGTSPSFIPVIESISEPKFQFSMDSSGVGPSDHTSFYLKGIPVLHFFTGQHEQYHKPGDDVELINFEGLMDVSIFIKNVIIELDSEDKLSFNKTRDEQVRKGSFKVTLGIIPDYLFSGNGLMIDGVKENRAAFKAGFLGGDIIVQMGKDPVKNINDYMKVLNKLDKGSSIVVVILRNQSKKTVLVVFD